MFRTRPRKRFGGRSVALIVATGALNIICSYFGVGSGESPLEIKQVVGHKLRQEDTCGGGTCANPPTSTWGMSWLSEAAAPGDSLLQVDTKQFTISGQPAFDLSERTGESFSEPHSQQLELLTSGARPVPKGNLVITVRPIKCSTSIYSPDGVCPAACPYFAQEGGKSRACYFQCLKKDQCGSLDPKDVIADEDLLICRKCKVLGCKRCAKGKRDKCGICDDGYELTPDGRCTNNHWKIWSAIFTIASVIGGILISWLLRLQLLPVTNMEGVKEGLAYRSSLKLRVPRSLAALVGADTEAEDRPLWPLSTNLHAVQVAGPGLTLHMNFQLAIIVWGCCIIVTWVIFTYFTEPDMLVLGLYPAETPQQLCSVTLRGREVQKRVLPTKVIYMVWMYMFTVVFNFAYALYQRHKFLVIADGTSMTDFAAICTGLPRMSGDELVEDMLKQCVEASSGEKVVGVSVCWDCNQHEEEVAGATDDEVQMLEGECAVQATTDGSKGLVGRLFGCIDSLFGFTGEVPGPAQSDRSVVDMLKKMSSTDSAFIVFETEASRDKAVLACKSSGGIPFQGTFVQLLQENCEPDTVKWTNFHVTSTEFYTKLSIGILVIIGALIVWCLGFYFPFAYYQASYAKQGEEPGFGAAFVFSMVVVAGNQIMYFVCGDISERVGFRFTDHQEALYISLYTLSCMMNLVVDMVMEFFLAYESAVAMGTHTADGRLLEDMSSYQEIFESYVMQKAVGSRLFHYCFPSTFLIPFLVEPIFAIFFPFHICKLLLRTHPECRGGEAEKSLNIFAPMDMGRYADLLLNLMLSVLIIFFPPGTFLKTMLALVVCHVCIYVYDQYRILRSVPAFDYASDRIDGLVQVLMGIATSILAAGIVFKGGCLPGTGVCLQRGPLVSAMGGAFVLNLAVHVVLIKVVVPRICDRREHQLSTETYAEAASSLPSTWFSENAVHCLRSKHVYKHDPPCMYNTRGKEHLIKKNPKCGVHYEGCKRIGHDEYDI